MTRNKAFRTCLAAALSAALLLACACALCGCRATDALTEVLYTQTSDNVDYDNPDKFIVNSDTAEEEDPTLSSLETSDDAPATDEEQNLVVYSSEPNTLGLTAKQTLFNQYPDFANLEPSKGVKLYYSDSTDAIDHEVEHESDETPQTTVVTTYSSNGSKGKSDGNGDTPDDTGTPTPEETEQGGGFGGTYAAYADASNVRTTMPPVSKIAAPAEYAVAVQMLAGSGVVVATDANTKGNEKLNRVCDFSSAYEGWDSAGNINVDNIVASGAELVICSGGLDEATKTQLAEHEIYVRDGFSMASTTAINNLVTRIGESLSQSHPSAATKATQYMNTLNDTLAECRNANGGYASKDGTVYETDGSCNATALTNAKYTLLIDEWDADGYALNSSLSSLDSGLAVAPVGYTISPVSWYIQCGGLINRGATAQTSSSRWVVSQISAGYGGSQKSDSWANAGSAQSYANDSSGFFYNLLSTGTGETATNSGGQYESFGTDTFPTLIVTSKTIQTGIVESSKSSTGLYHAFSIVSYSTLGFMNGTTPIPTTIGAHVGDSGLAEQVLDGVIPTNRVKLNPCGLTGSWTEGNVESFLEAVWVNDEVTNENDTTKQLNWRQKTWDFYYDYFGYQLSEDELDDIANGEDD